MRTKRDPSLAPDTGRRWLARTIVVASILLGSLPEGQATELRLVLRDQAGHAVHGATAELFLVEDGGFFTRVPLPLRPQASFLPVPLEEQELRELFRSQPDAPEFNVIEQGFLYLQAPGYAPIRSQSFGWPRVSVGSTASVEIRFPRGERVLVHAGETVSLELVLRRPQARSLRLMDDEGRPIPGVKVQSFVFGSVAGHCGVLEGELLGEEVSDEDGRVPVPDGDVEYAFVVEKRPYILRQDSASFFDLLVTTLKRQETVVPLHAWRLLPLKLRVLRDGKPAGGQVLSGCRKLDGHCSSCPSIIATSGDTGTLDVPEFYPEEWEAVFIEGEGGIRLWEANPEDWLDNGAPSELHVATEASSASPP